MFKPLPFWVRYLRNRLPETPPLPYIPSIKTVHEEKMRRGGVGNKEQFAERFLSLVAALSVLLWIPRKEMQGLRHNCGPHRVTELARTGACHWVRSLSNPLSQDPSLQHPSSRGPGPPPAAPAVRQHRGPEISITTRPLMDDPLKSAGQRWFGFDVYKHRFHELWASECEGQPAMFFYQLPGRKSLKTSCRKLQNILL